MDGWEDGQVDGLCIGWVDGWVGRWLSGLGVEWSGEGETEKVVSSPTPGPPRIQQDPTGRK